MKNPDFVIAPSILSANFAKLVEEVAGIAVELGALEADIGRHISRRRLEDRLGFQFA